MSAQIIEKDGRPEWAVIPYDEYRDLLDALEEKADAALAAEVLQRIETGEEEVIPAEITERLLDESPYRVWREYRQITQDAVANAAGVSKAYISQIEAGQKTPSGKVKAAIATALGVAAEDLD